MLLQHSVKSHGLISGNTELPPLTIAYVSKLQDLPKPFKKICKLGEAQYLLHGIIVSIK